ncbi:putative two-component system response regulator [Actinoplanes missouriensis 431]|uniref:Putative two-component system response regulator n=1 Tax=Actinoplanes missouriensis (strain ATCC 14538 / DSM 43046 / CBS 188.64 / JCM 3121 / NBRC 102363 / NCIMB 12654 / NRRL B-3342 / UNCC 431) TaxID=512565 RepID=I0H4M6_ACTM4|nr:response regulator transcription factor [Actinoplanes missouriensis]BAL87963.1 putative two-component system response regulator [Actinoplanes missouriensis 431]
MTTIRVLLADDHALIRSALHMVLADAGDIEVAGEAQTGADAVRLSRELHPDVVLMDIRMPGLDGIEATRRITAEPGGPHVVVLTTFDDDEYVYGALRAGASGFLVKDMALEEIVTAVRVVATGDALIAPSVTRRLIAMVARHPSPAPGGPVPLNGITGRERQVLTLIGQGATNAEIAERMHITTPTVKSYVGRLMTKLDARDRVQLVIVAYRTGLVTP